MKWLARLLIGLVALVVVVFGAAAIFLATIDANDYKELIANKVSEATGRTLSIEGDIELSFFPWLGLELGQTHLSNAPGFGDAAFARVNAVQVRVALLPLLRGEVKADTVSLKGLRLNLSRSKAGVTNWQDLLKQGAPEAPAKRDAPASDENAAALAIAVGGIDIEDAALHWQDAQTGNELVVSPFHLQTGALKPGEPFELTMNVAMANQNPPLTASAKLSGEITADPRQQRYRLEGVRLEVDAQGKALPGGRLEGELQASAVADLQAQTLKVSTLTVEAMELLLAGQFDVTQLQAAPHISGSLESERFSPRQLLERLNMAQSATADPGVLQRATLALQFQGSPEAAEVSGLKVTVDDSTLIGHASVKSFAKPQIRFSLALDQIDLDRYLPPPVKASASEETKPGPAREAPRRPAENTLQLPVEAMRNLDIAGEIKVDQLKVANLQLASMIAELSGKGGLVSLKPLRTALYGGRIDSGLSVDVRGKVPAFSAAAELESVQMGPLTAALQQGKGSLDGTGAFSANLQTRGDRVADLKRRLNGQFSFSVTEGALYDKKLAAAVQAAVAFLKGRAPKPSGEAIVFESLTGSGPIKDGILSNQDLQLIASLILAKGEGTVNLAADAVDYTLSLALAGGSEDKKRVFVPITVEGPYADLNYGVNLEKVATETLKSEAEKRIGKELEKAIPKELGAPLREGLKGLLGR